MKKSIIYLLALIMVTGAVTESFADGPKKGKHKSHKKAKEKKSRYMFNFQN